MAVVHFYLKGALSNENLHALKESDIANYDLYLNKRLQIFCKVSTAGKRLQVFTTKRIEPKFWDFGKERCNTKLYKKHGGELNKFLGDLYDDAFRIAEEGENKGVAITNEALRILIKPKDAQVIVKEQETPFDVRWKYFLENHKTKKGFPVRKNTIKVYDTLKKYLFAFCEKKGYSLTLGRMDKNFVSEFQSELNNGLSLPRKKKLTDGSKTNHINRKLTDSSKAKYIDWLKTFIKFYQEKDLIKSFRLADVKVSQGEGEIYVLTLQRLLKLQYQEIEDIRLAKVRDQFCFMCWTGQRISDYATINKKDFIKNDKGIWVWRLSAKKSTQGKLLSVPIIEYAKEIYARYNGPPEIEVAEQTFNDSLKELGKLVELDFPVKTIKYYNGVPEIDTLPFYEVLTAHVARKTFITNSLILGVPERVVREISDHKDEKSFRRYINLADSYKNAKLFEAYSKGNVERTLNLIGDEERFTDLDASEDFRNLKPKK